MPASGKVILEARHPAGVAIVEIAEAGGTTIRVEDHSEAVELGSAAGQAILDAARRYSDPGRRGAKRACIVAGIVDFEMRRAFQLRQTTAS